MKKLTGILIALLTLCLILSVPAFATESTGETASETPRTLATPTLVGASLSLEDRVHIWFALYVGEDALADTEYGMIFWTAEKSNEDDYTMENATNDSAIIVKGGESHSASVDHPELGTLQVREFDYSVAAKEMTDMVYARGYIKNGDEYTYTKMVPYSVQTYAGNMLGIYPGTTRTTDEALVEMIETMLHFGAASQKYFKYRTDDLADTILKWSEGLEYTDNGDGTCSVSGIGEFTGKELHIPKVALNGDCAGMKVTSIGDRAFSSCYSLTSITIPDSVTSIGDYAFYGCSGLTSITIPDSVTGIDDGAFSGCDGLTSITVDEKNTVYHSAGNCIIKTKTKTLVAGCKNSVIPTDGSVTSIGRCAFRGCTGLTSVTIPNSVTSIGSCAFRGCTGLTSITIPNSVTSIGDSAFSNCTGLTSITIPDSVTSIDWGAFRVCLDLTSITVDEGNTVYRSDGNCLIEIASKTLITGCKNSVIPNDGSVTSIGEEAFWYCTGLTSITIPNSVTNIGVQAFGWCTGLASITISDSVKSISRDAFINTAYYNDSSNWDGGVLYISNHLIEADQRLSGSYSIKKGTKCIADWAFFSCTELTSITIPDSVTSVGEGAFHDCPNLTNIMIPASVTSIGNSVFSDCVNLASITVDSGNSKYCSYGNCLIESAAETIIAGCKNSLIASSKYSFADVTSIGDYAFSGLTGLKSIGIPDTITSIGYRAFANSGLTDIYYPGTESEWNAISKASNWDYGITYTVHYCAYDYYWEIENKIISLMYTKDCLINGNWAVTLNGTQYDSVPALYNSFTGTVQDGKFTVEPKAGYKYALNVERTEIYLRQLANVKDRVSAKISAINLFDYGITTGTTPADAYNAAVAELEKIMIQASNTASDGLPEATSLDDYSFPIAYSRNYTATYDWSSYSGVVESDEVIYLRWLDYLKDDIVISEFQVTLNGTQYDSVTTLYNSFTGTVQDGKFIVAPRSGYEYGLNTQRTQLYLAQLAKVKDNVVAKILAINLFDYGISTGTTPADAYNAAVAELEKIIIQASVTESDCKYKTESLDDYSFPIAYSRYYNVSTTYDWGYYNGTK